MMAIVVCLALVGPPMTTPALAGSAPVQKVSQTGQDQPGRHLEPSEIVAGTWLVGLHSPQSRAAVSKALRNLGAKVTRVSYKGTVVEFEASNEIAVLAQGFEGVRYVEPLVRVSALYTPTDTEYVHQWGLPRIGAPMAWNETMGSNGVVVAIVDTGVLLSHEDLAAHLDTVNDYDFANNDSTANDDLGHGTHVAGIAAAMANGVYGVGVAPNCTILPVKVLDANGDGDSYWVAEGIQWAADHGADVINLSLGSYSSSQVEAEAVAYAQAKDVVVVGASGNDGVNSVTYPAALDGVIAVGATDSSDAVCDFSNGGPRLDLVAPGKTIYSTSITGRMTMMDGTSMAAPFVSGAAALLRSKFPELSEAQVVACLEASSEDLGAPGRDDVYGRGLLDVAAALDRAAQLPPDLTPPTVSITAPAQGATVSGLVPIAAAASDDRGVVARVDFRVDGTLLLSDAAAPYTTTWDARGASPGPHAITAAAYDAAGNGAVSSVDVIVPDTTPPSVSITGPANGAEVSGLVALAASASDNVGVARVEFRVDGALLAAYASAPYAATWNASTVLAGFHIITATAYDAAGNSAVSSLGVTVPDTTKPSVSISAPADGAEVSGLVALSASASDNVRVARVEFGADGVLISSDASAPYAATWDASTVSAGLHIITATAFDAAGNTAESSVLVTVPMPPRPTTLTGSSGTKTASYNGAVTIYAELKSGDVLVGMPGRSPFLEYSSNGTSGWTTANTAIVGSAYGRYQATVRRTSTLYYRFRFTGDEDYGYEPSTGPVVKVYPKAYLTNPYAPTSAYRNRAFPVYGYLKPRHTTGGYPVRIYKYRYVSGVWKSYGYITARAYNYSSYTKYLKALSLPYVGKWRLRAYSPADSGHAAAWSSGYDYVTVK